jgi:hypothetical protein
MTATKPAMPMSANVVTGAQAMAASMREDSDACRVAALQYGRSTLEYAAKTARKSPGKALGAAADVKAVTSTVALAGSWSGSEADRGPASVVNLSVLLDGCPAPERLAAAREVPERHETAETLPDA